MFEHLSVKRIIFGEKTAEKLSEYISPFGKKVLIFTGKNRNRQENIFEELQKEGYEFEFYGIDHEPNLDDVEEAGLLCRKFKPQVILAIGGGSVLDMGKAVAALSKQPKEAQHYLEVIGKGNPLDVRPLPVIAVPTTSGTGSEVTKNSVLCSASNKVKISLRDNEMLPAAAIVDPCLTYGTNRTITAMTGMDAITQTLEPYVSPFATPFTDALCEAALKIGLNALNRLMNNLEDKEARREMAMTSLIGGLALTNAKLGAVHGFAGTLGGTTGAPHGTICAVLLPVVTEFNLLHLPQGHPAERKYDRAVQLMTGNSNANRFELPKILKKMLETTQLSLENWTLPQAIYMPVIEAAGKSSSMKGNPILLDDLVLEKILTKVYSPESL